MGRAQLLHAQPGGVMEWYGVGVCQCSFVSRLISRAKSPYMEGFLKALHAGPGELCGLKQDW